MTDVSNHNTNQKRFLIRYIALTLLCIIAWFSILEPVLATDLDAKPKPTLEAPLTDECHISVGVVPQFEQRKIFTIWDQLLKSLGAQTNCLFTLKGSQSITEFENAFSQGAYDMAYMNPFHATMAHKAQGYQPIIRAKNKKLKGVLVVRKDSEIDNVSALNNAVVVYPSPNALGASLLMRAELSNQHNVKTKERYVKTHSSVYLFVAKGLAKAGGGVGRTLAEQPKHIRDRLRVLYTTQAVHPHPIVMHPRVPSRFRERITKGMLALYQSQPALFFPIPMAEITETSLKDYAPLENMQLERFASQAKQ